MLNGYQPYPMDGGLGNIYIATVSETALPAYTATILGGPLLYNGSGTGASTQKVVARLLSMSYGLTLAATAAAAVGICGGATTAPTSASTTGLISSNANLRTGAPGPQCTVYTSGTVSVAATLWLPTGQVGTAALTAEIADDNFVHLGGVISVTPGFFICPAASATLTTAVQQLSICWMEVPVEV